MGLFPVKGFIIASLLLSKTFHNLYRLGFIAMAHLPKIEIYYLISGDNPSCFIIDLNKKQNS
jgi:hypothetical protein